MPPLTPTSPALVATTRSLRVDLVTAEVGAAFARAGVPHILLKGPSVALWLYPNGAGRRYVDTDLLVPPTAKRRAEAVLSSLGFGDLLAGASADEQDPDACLWWRERDRASVDLHRRLRGAGVSEAEVFRVLGPQTETMPVAGRPTPILKPAARALNIALHAAHDGIGNRQSLGDLTRAIDQLPLATWEAAARLAVALDATPSYVAGLCLLPAGRALAVRLELPMFRSVTDGLRAISAPALAAGFARLDEIPGRRAKLRFLKQNLLPSPSFLRSWSRLAHHGWPGMALAYGWRLTFCTWNAIPGYRAWRRAQRAARRPL
jgi:hypothetical protein